MPPPRILLIFAHPDDESFIAAGLVRGHADRGARTALVTATRGDAGRVGDPPLCDRAELPAVREAELRRAAAVLGISHVQLLDYRDKHLAEAPANAVREALVRRIRGHRPHVVISFDPDGMNGHPDHVAIARFTIDAAVAAADPRWMDGAGRPYRVPRLLWTTPVLPWEVTRPRHLDREPGVDFVVNVAAQRAAKAAALRAHRTQHVPIDRCFFSKPDVDRILSVEVFRQAWGPPLTRSPPNSARPTRRVVASGAFSVSQTSSRFKLFSRDVSWEVLSPAGIGQGILEDLDQAGREPGMEARVDLVEQEDPAESERRERRTDQTEPGPGSGRFFLQIESDRFTFSAMHETKATTRSTGAPGVLFADHQIVDSRIRKAKQVQDTPWILDGWSLLRRTKETRLIGLICLDEQA